MNRRTVILLTGITLFGSTAMFPQTGYAQTDPFIGTWQLNVAKSKFSPGPLPRSQTTNVQEDGQIHRHSVTGIDALGNPISAAFTRTFDGLPHPSTGPIDFDAATITRAGANTIIISRRKAGKLVQIVTDVLSQDGKTLTATTTGTDANGRPINNIAVYDKQ